MGPTSASSLSLCLDRETETLTLELYHQSTRRKDKRKGITYCSESDTEHSTGSETSFDYDQVEEELAEEIYAERDAGIVCV